LSTISGAVHAILRFGVFSLFAITALVGIFVAWWLVVLAAVVLGCYIVFMRFFGAGWSTPAGKVTLEGEYQVERDSESRRSSGKGMARRIAEADPDVVQKVDKNQP
jgi:hypothetical protein